MRILIWDQLRKELESNAAFNLAFFRAIDPRIITRRPRDPEKACLMKELGIETTVDVVGKHTGSHDKKTTGRKKVQTQKKDSTRKLLKPIGGIEIVFEPENSD
jgi:hypothetical protein